jgi:hypothetical protein
MHSASGALTCDGSGGGALAACYSREVKARMPRLVSVALIAVLSGTPAFAAVCAELCGLRTASASTSAHCSKHAAAHTADTAQPSASAHYAMRAVSHHRSDRGAVHQGHEERVAVSLSHGPDCCGRLTLAVAVATKVSRTDGALNPVVVPSGPYVSVPIARAEVRLLQPGSSGPIALSRAPRVLRI